MSYPQLFENGGIGEFFKKVDEEVSRQIEIFGVQHHPDGTSKAQFAGMRDLIRDDCDRAQVSGRQQWLKIAFEEQYEIAAEEDPEKLDVEITQLAAVLASWWLDHRRQELKAATAQQAADAHDVTKTQRMVETSRVQEAGVFIQTFERPLPPAQPDSCGTEPLPES